MCYEFKTPLFPDQLLQARQSDLSVTSTQQSVNRWRHNEYSCGSHPLLFVQASHTPVVKVRLVVWQSELTGQGASKLTSPLLNQWCTVQYSTYMNMAVQSLCTLPVNRKFISENDWQLRAPHLPAYFPRLSPAMDSDTELDQDVSIIININMPRHNVFITYQDWPKINRNKKG